MYSMYELVLIVTAEGPRMKHPVLWKFYYIIISNVLMSLYYNPM